MSEDGRVALVTGGNRGLGRAIAQRLRADGHRVAVTTRSDPPAELASSGIVAVQADVTDAAQIDAAVSEVEERLGPVEVLVANAGITHDSLVLRMSDDDFSRVIDTNLSGSFRVARRVAKTMMRNRFGRMIFISSVVGLGGQAGQANYAASKAGLIGLSRSLAREFASRNITANVVAPGPVSTDMLDALTDQQRQAIIDTVPLARFAEPTEVAALVAFLAGNEAGYITGAIIPVDGGLSMGS